MSADPVAARRPCAVVTKMVCSDGWKRLEMNDSMKFGSITESTFPSIMRRSLVILMKGRIISEEQMETIGVVPG